MTLHFGKRSEPVAFFRLPQDRGPSALLKSYENNAPGVGHMGPGRGECTVKVDEGEDELKGVIVK